jgi:hypothetical protein
MSYIGKTPTIGNFQVCDAISVVNGQAAYTMQVNSVNVVPESANHMLVSLNGILQKPGGSFTVSGSTITFASNLATGDVIDFITLLGNVLDLGTPSDATVTNAKTNFVSTSSAAGLQIKGDGTTDGTLQLNCSQNSHGIKLKSPSHGSAQSYTLTFPTTAPSSGTALITDGSGNLSFGSAGGLVKLASTTLSGASAGIAFNSTYVNSTYDNYYLFINGILPVTDNADIGVYASVDNGSNFATILSGNHYLQLNGSGNGWQYSQNAHYVAHDCSNVAGELKVSGYAIVENVNDTSAWKGIFGKGITQNSGTKANDYSYVTLSTVSTTSAINYLMVKANSGNLQGFGTVTLYGVVK